MTRPSELARRYNLLTGEERFRLAMAANDRADTSEAERLVRSANTRTITWSDHVPYAEAFFEVMVLTYLDVVVGLAGMNESLLDPDRADEARARAYLVVETVAGWSTFCARLGVQPTSCWQYLAGVALVERGIARASDLAFNQADLLAWWASQGRPDPGDQLVTADRVHNQCDQLYRSRIRHRGSSYMGANGSK